MLEISNIKIIGVGRAGISILNDIYTKIPGASFVAIDTDANALANCAVSEKICLIENGEGSGGDVDIAKNAAAAKYQQLLSISSGTRLAIIIAGLGNGTGSVVAPMLSKILSENTELEVLSFSTLPFAIEGTDKSKLARKAQAYLSKRCRAAFSLPNDIILAKQNLPIADAYKAANSDIANIVCAALKSATSKGIVNIDFPTFIKIFSTKDEGVIPTFAAFGRGYGENAVDEAIEELLQSPLLPKNFKARSMLLSLRCSPAFGMNKMQALLELASNKFGMPSKFAFGAIAEDDFDTNIEVCAVGLCDLCEQQQTPVPITVEEHPSANLQEMPEQEQASIESDTSQTLDETKTFANTSQQDLSEDATVDSLQEEVQDEEQKVQIPKEEIKIAPPPERIDVSVKPVPVEPEKRSFFGFGRRKKSQKKVSIDNDQQTEFGFMELSEQRGFFLDTPPNIRNGEDLDVPTYMRRGIKINL